MSRAGTILFLLPFALGSAVAQGLAGREDIWADFAQNDLQGVKPMHAGGQFDYVERDLDGVHCVATDGASGKHWLCFDVPREFITSTQPTRYTLIIRYLDSPANGLVTVRYHAARDAMAQAIRFQRQGSGEWRELVLPLSDAVFMNGTMGVADFAVHGFTDTGDPRAADVFVSGVWLSKRVLEVSASPSALAVGADPAQQTCTVRALAYAGTGGLAPDGTVIQFSATAGTIDPEAQTKDGVAEAKFTSDGAPGTAVVTADWDVVSGWTTIAKVPGDQPLQPGHWRAPSFDEVLAGDLERVNADTSFADVVDPERGPARSLQLHYCFHTGAPGQPYVTCPLAIPIPGRPEAVSLQARGDGSPHHFQLLVQDAQGAMYTIMSAARALQPDWQEITLPVESFDDCWGTNADGVMDFPITIVGARFVCLGGNQLEGDIYLGDLRAEGLFPQDALEQPEAATPGAERRSPSGLLVAGPREPLAYIAENIVGLDDPNALVDQVRQLRGTPSGREAEALVALKRLVELAPENPYYRWWLGGSLLKVGDFEGALVSLEVCLQTPGYWSNWGHVLRARCLDELGRREEASREYAAMAEAIPQADPDQQTFHFPGIVRVWTEVCKEGMGKPLPFYKLAPNASPDYQEITDTTEWTAQCDRLVELLPFALDRNPESCWALGGDQQTGDWFQLDLGEVVLDVARVVLDDDGGSCLYPWDFPGELRVEGSVDGRQWELLGTAHGDPRFVIDVAWDPRPLRFIRATLTENTPKGDFTEWRIYEAYVYRKAPA